MFQEKTWVQQQLPDTLRGTLRLREDAIPTECLSRISDKHSVEQITGQDRIEQDIESEIGSSTSNGEDSNELRLLKKKLEETLKAKEELARKLKKTEKILEVKDRQISKSENKEKKYKCNFGYRFHTWTSENSLQPQSEVKMEC